MRKEDIYYVADVYLKENVLILTIVQKFSVCFIAL